MKTKNLFCPFFFLYYILCLKTVVKTRMRLEFNYRFQYFVFGCLLFVASKTFTKLYLLSSSPTSRAESKGKSDNVNLIFYESLRRNNFSFAFFTTRSGVSSSTGGGKCSGSSQQWSCWRSLLYMSRPRCTAFDKNTNIRWLM